MGERAAGTNDGNNRRAKLVTTIANNACRGVRGQNIRPGSESIVAFTSRPDRLAASLQDIYSDKDKMTLDAFSEAPNFNRCDKF